VEHPPAARWAVGLRRSWIESEALAEWVRDRGVTGAVWTPATYAPDDVADGLVRLVTAGAVPDANLLWDFAIEDIRAAAAALAPVFKESEELDGCVAVWLDPAKLVDPGRAAAAADELDADVNRRNVVSAFAWSGARAGALSAIVARGLPVAVSGVRDKTTAEAVRAARQKGIDRALSQAPEEEREDVPEAPVYLLGAPSGLGDEEVRAVDLAGERELAGVPSATPARLPLSQEAEAAGSRTAVERMAGRAKRQVHEDGLLPESFAADTGRILVDLQRDDVLQRLWAHDHTLWRDEPTEIADRLGWLDVAERMRAECDDLATFARRAASDAGVGHVLLLGMGGSSLTPETFRTTVGGARPLTVLDTTHPDHVRETVDGLDLERTLVVVSSKSGTTLETLTALEYVWSRSQRGNRFVAITDPGTPLAETAKQRGFLRVFENPPDIGGRYSALSYFGLVPAVLCGIDVAALLDAALEMLDRHPPTGVATRCPGLRLGAALGTAAKAGQDKLTLLLPEPLAALGDWVEQLIAESTGKEGTGVVPVVGETTGAPDVYGPDRLFVAYAIGDDAFPAALESLEAEHPVVRIRVQGPGDVGAEMYRWEVATAVLGRILGINPFDQPDVESAKQRTREFLEASDAPLPPMTPAADLLAGLEPSTSVAIQAFLRPTAENAGRLRAAATALRDRSRAAVTVGFGPRFLHSTGQLHKGGPDTVLCVQVTEAHGDLEIPGRPFTFGRLFDAQADGDLKALLDAGRRVTRVTPAELASAAGGAPVVEPPPPADDPAPSEEGEGSPPTPAGRGEE
jgi:glucose-6-phosphate isomerase